MGLVATVTLDEVAAHLNLDVNSPTWAAHSTELAGFIAAADERVGDIGIATLTETLTVVDGAMWASRWPVTAVTSASYGARELVAGFTVSRTGKITHPDITSGTWKVTYTAGWSALPSDLRLVVLEDIRGLYQAGQIGPPGAMGAFGIDAAPLAGFRPVQMWPRIDAWLDRHYGPVAV